MILTRNGIVGVAAVAFNLELPRAKLILFQYDSQIAKGPSCHKGKEGRKKQNWDQNNPKLKLGFSKNKKTKKIRIQK